MNKKSQLLPSVGGLKEHAVDFPAMINARFAAMCQFADAPQSHGIPNLQVIKELRQMYADKILSETQVADLKGQHKVEFNFYSHREADNLLTEGKLIFDKKCSRLAARAKIDDGAHKWSNYGVVKFLFDEENQLTQVEYNVGNQKRKNLDTENSREI